MKTFFTCQGPTSTLQIRRKIHTGWFLLLKIITNHQENTLYKARHAEFIKNSAFKGETKSNGSYAAYQWSNPPIWIKQIKQIQGTQ